MASKNIELSECLNEFTLDIYKHVIVNQTSSNVFMSPSSMMVVLTMLYVGARTNTKDQMTKVLKLNKMENTDVLKNMEAFVNTLKKGSKYITLSAANRLFPHNDKTILDEYVSLVMKHFSADVKLMDYTTKAEEARQEINQWVEGETNSKIKNLLPGGSLNSLTAMVVVNAIYFKGNWATQFEPRFTKKSDFTKLNSDKVQVDMMSQHMKKVKYGENQHLACKILELPYEGEELGMIVVLPNSNDGLPALETRLTLKVIQSLVASVHTSTVDVSLPKFKLETSLELKAALSALGMVDLFEQESADLSGMGRDLYVSQVFHKAFVDVNEEGTEAAAATGAVFMMTSMSIIPDFNADHPFMFMIWDHRLDVPLFIGRLADPANSPRPMTQQKEEL